MTDDDILTYLSRAERHQLLALLVEGVYSRDRDDSDIPVLRRMEGSYKEDIKAEFYASKFWTRMRGTDEGAEKALGVRHYLKLLPEATPGSQYNTIHYHLVIAIRGTKISNFQDICDDIRVAHRTLHRSRRFHGTLDLIKGIISVFYEDYGGRPEEVCITGHFLGAATALLVGKEIAKDQTLRVDVHCFNPPLLSVLMIIKKFFGVDTAKDMLRGCPILKPIFQVLSVSKDLGKMALLFMLANHEALSHERYHFLSLVEWMPTLYVNDGDLISKEYQRFYKWKHDLHHRNPQEPIFMTTVVLQMISKNPKYSILVPSVKMVTSHCRPNCHSLKRWYEDVDLQLREVEYKLVKATPVVEIGLRGLRKLPSCPKVSAACL